MLIGACNSDVVSDSRFLGLDRCSDHDVSAGGRALRGVDAAAAAEDRAVQPLHVHLIGPLCPDPRRARLLLPCTATSFEIFLTCFLSPIPTPHAP